VARRALAALSALLVAVALVGCGDGSAAPAGIEDPAATASQGPVPDWYTAPVRPPAGSAVVDAIDAPEPGFGRTVTWRVPGSHEETVSHVERTFASLGWKETDRTDVSEGGSRRTNLYVENDRVFAVRVFSDEALKGVRLTVELPAAG
jgi:hypothetical protein